MKIIATKNDLRNALNTVAPAVATKSADPITACVLIKTIAPTTLEIRATNFTTEIAVHIPCNVEEEGATAIAGKTATAIVQKFAGEIVTLTANGNTAALKSEAATFELPVSNPTDFPEPIAFTPTATFAAPANAFTDLVSRVAFAAAKNNDRPAITGVRFTLNSGTLTAAATNTHRIAVKEISVDANSAAEFIVPSTTLAALTSLANGTIHFDIGSNSFSAESGNARITGQLLEGTFPDVNRFLSVQATISQATSATVAVKELADAISRVQIIARQTEYSAITFKFTDDGLELLSTSHATGRAIEHVDAITEGDDLTISFNFNYIVDALRAVNSKSCTFKMTEPLKPAFITGDGDDSFTYVVTPLRN